MSSHPVFVIFLMVVFEVLARPKTEILYHRNLRQSHQYEFEYEAEDGSRRQEVGTLIYKDNKTEPVLHVKGMYSYFVDGQKFEVHYEADDKGTRQNEDFTSLTLTNKLA